MWASVYWLLLALAVFLGAVVSLLVVSAVLFKDTYEGACN